MLSNLTWWEFFGFYSLFLLLYYPLIISIYFRPQVFRILRRTTSGALLPITPATPETPIRETSSSSESISDEETKQLIESLKKEITSGIKSAKDTGASREGLLSLLRSLLSKYPELKKTGQHVEINEFIVQQAGAARYPVQVADTYALWPAAAVPA